MVGIVLIMKICFIHDKILTLDYRLMYRLFLNSMSFPLTEETFLPLDY